MDGWAGDITGRRAGKERADKRAMAIEDERLRTEAPNNDRLRPETAERSRMRGQVRGRGRGGAPMEDWLRMRTNGATPSLGLSEFRGGRHGEESSSDEEMVGGGMVIGGARSRGRKSVKANSQTAMEEAHGMGKAMGDHIHDLHGGAFHKRFLEGMKGSGFFSDLISKIPVIGPIAGTIAGVAGLGRRKKPQHLMPDGTMMNDEDMPMKGGRKKRAPAGANDGRRKRAEVVRKVMADKGLSMIEASKWVKAHNLY